MRSLLILSTIVTLMYAGLFAAYVRIFLDEHSAVAKHVRVLAPAVVALHIVFLVMLGVALKHPPLTAPFESTSSLAMLIALVYVYVEARTRIRSTGALIFFFVCGLQLVSAVLLAVTPAAPAALGSPVLNAHIALALLGYTAFCLSFLYSIMYLILHEDIKKSNFGLIYEKLPSLEQLDDMNFKTAAAGAAVMGLSIAIGFVWAWTAFGRLPIGDVKVLTTIGTTAIYAAILVLRRRLGWGGERTALMSLFGFFAVLTSLMVLNMFSETLHSFF